MAWYLITGTLYLKAYFYLNATPTIFSGLFRNNRKLAKSGSVDSAALPVRRQTASVKSLLQSPDHLHFPSPISGLISTLFFLSMQELINENLLHILGLKLVKIMLN